MRTKIFFTYSITLLLIISCSKENPVNPYEKNNFVINDIIPFNSLSTGKIVFERIGLQGKYEGIGIINIQSRSVSALNTAHESVVVSPDGSKLAFIKPDNTLHNQWPFDTFVMPIEGKNEINISGINGQDKCPSWSPDSKSVFFWLMNPSTYAKELYKVDIDAMANKKLIFNSAYSAPLTPISISISGMIVYYSSSYKLYFWDIDHLTISREVSLPESGFVYTPRWSPDGKKIAFTQATPIRYKIIIYDDITSEFKTIYELENGKGSTSICWSPDGQRLAFNINSTAGSHIYLINVDGTGLTQITSEPGVYDQSVSWSLI